MTDDPLDARLSLASGSIREIANWDGPPVGASPPKYRSWVIYGMCCHIEGFLYIKIGKTKDLMKRVSGVQVGCPAPLETVLVMEMPSKEAMDAAERSLHNDLTTYNTNGEWFSFDMDDPIDKERFLDASERAFGEGRKWVSVDITTKGLNRNLMQLREVTPRKYKEWIPPPPTPDPEHVRRIKAGLSPNFWKG